MQTPAELPPHASTRPTPPPPHNAPSTGLLVIGCYKLVQGLLLLLLAFGFLKLLHRDTAEVLKKIIRAVRVDPENRHITGLLAKAGLVTDHRLRELSALTALYGGVFITEGLGLLWKKRWAEYLTVIATGSLIPLEIYEVAQRATVWSVSLLLGNSAILIYLIRILRREKPVLPPPL